MRKPPTINDVAVALGMHKSTVSLALSGKGTISAETRRKVLETATQLGYEPNAHAQRLAQGQSATHVCIYSTSLDVGLATEKILMIQQALTTRSLEVPLYTGYVPEPTSDDLDDDGPAHPGYRESHLGELQARQVRQLIRLRPRLIVAYAMRAHPLVLRELENYQKAGGTLIAYDIAIPVPCDQVVFDREDNAYRATLHLLEQGHRKIGFRISLPDHTSQRPDVIRYSDIDRFEAQKSYDPQAQRLSGFRRALKEYGLSLREEWFFQTSTYEKGGAEMARQFLQLKERPTAIAIVNDYVAMAFMVEMLRAGIRVPEDLSIIGHDNQPIAEYCPVPLTTMTQPVDSIVQAVTDLVSRHIDTDPLPSEPARTILLRGELVPRKSVMPLGK